MPLRDVADNGSFFEALRYDCQLLLQRPLPPPLRAGKDLTTPGPLRIGVITNHVINVITMRAHGAASSQNLRPTDTWGRSTAYCRPLCCTEARLAKNPRN